MPQQKKKQDNDGKVEVFCKFIHRKGKKIPPPNGKKVWHFWATPKKKVA